VRPKDYVNKRFQLHNWGSNLRATRIDMSSVFLAYYHVILTVAFTKPFSMYFRSGANGIVTMFLNTFKVEYGNLRRILYGAPF
jgi:hypothetical protein